MTALDNYGWECRCGEFNAIGRGVCVCGRAPQVGKTAQKGHNAGSAASSATNRGESDFEAWFLAKWLLVAPTYPEPVREYRFHPKRKWRFDFAWPDCQVAVEIEGGVWRAGVMFAGKGTSTISKSITRPLCLGGRYCAMLQGTMVILNRLCKC